LRPFFSKLKRWQLVAIGLGVLLFFPVPTEMVPEWTMQFHDENGSPLSRVVVQQEWQTYTYFARRGFEQKCSDESGIVTFPKRYLWSGIFARIVSPPLADVLTLAHGSSGTSASVQVFDKGYISDNYYWRDKMELYKHFPESLPNEGTAEKWVRDYTQTCEELGLIK
jgi:hypothetical protein